jgi:hypothetical protein
MSKTDKKPIDPFSNISLDSFKKDVSQEKSLERMEAHPDKKTIKAIAEESNFQSREAAPKKQKIMTKTFSLFQEECNIINSIIRQYLENHEYDSSQPSGSDVVRAALYTLATKSPKEQVALVKQYRGRKKK